MGKRARLSTKRSLALALLLLLLFWWWRRRCSKREERRFGASGEQREEGEERREVLRVEGEEGTKERGEEAHALS